MLSITLIVRVVPLSCMNAPQLHKLQLDPACSLNTLTQSGWMKLRLYVPVDLKVINASRGRQYPVPYHRPAIRRRHLIGFAGLIFETNCVFFLYIHNYIVCRIFVLLHCFRNCINNIQVAQFQTIIVHYSCRLTLWIFYIIG